MSDNSLNKDLKPFSCTFSPEVPNILLKLKCSIAVSTYQAGKIVFISAKNKYSLIQLPRNFHKAMGIAEDEKNDKIAIACKEEVIVFKNSKELAKYYPKSPDKYDCLYLPRSTFHTGALDIHDLSFGNKNNLFAVNTLFSCIVKINDDYNFEPYWTPPQIDKITSEDRCHLNGMAMQNGKPKYATAFNQGNHERSWKENITKTGVIYDVESNKIIAKNLPMPHTPRIFNGKLYVLLSATGELAQININDGSYNVVIKIDGFVRGMSLNGEYLFIGLSKIRKKSTTFSKLPFAKKATESGIIILHLPTAKFVGKIIYQNSLDEIYDIHVLKNKLRPNILNTIEDYHKSGLAIPKSTFWKKINN